MTISSHFWCFLMILLTEKLILIFENESLIFQSSKVKNKSCFIHTISEWNAEFQTTVFRGRNYISTFPPSCQVELAKCENFTFLEMVSFRTSLGFVRLVKKKKFYIVGLFLEVMKYKSYSNLYLCT